MQHAKLNAKEHRQIAEAIILGQKVWGDFDFPTQDDKLHVKAIVDRGVQALGEEQRHVKQRVKQNMGGGVTVKEFVLGPSLSELLSSGSFTPFCLERVEGEAGIFRRHLFEAFRHSLSPHELSSLITKHGHAFHSILTEEEKKVLETGSKEVHPVPYGVASAVALKFVEKNSEKTESLDKYVAEYRQILQKDLEEHCKGLFRILSLDTLLAEYSQKQWKRLVGLTPRDHFAMMAFSLSSDIYTKFLDRLPEKQKPNLVESVAWNKMERGRRLELFGDVVAALKKWVGLVNKVAREV